MTDQHMAEGSSGLSGDRFDRAVPVADAVLWEGYLLYPYRASAAKNRLRFNWGLVGPAEEATMASTVLVERSTPSLDVRVRFLHLVRRDDGWDEAEPVWHDLSVAVAGLEASPVRSPFTVAGATEAAPDEGRRHRRSLEGLVTVTARCVADVLAVTVAVENLTQCHTDDRDEALRASFVGCHLFLAGPPDTFISLLEPPDHLAEVVSGLHQHRAWPVLIGPEPGRDLMLASPVILYDYPAIAPQSVGDFYDSTEIDEMLALRVHTLTEEEKAEARALDPRARAIIDRHDRLVPETMADLHGTTRTPAHPDPVEVQAETAPVDPNPEWSDPGPDTALIDGRWIGTGSKVRLEPTKRADVHDMFLKGRTATVAEIVHDVDGEIHVAVTVDDDPGADLFVAQRRFLYFAPEEMVPLGGDDG